MEYVVNGEIITIDETKRPYGEGSEGKLFLKNGNLYKIYHKEDLRTYKDKFSYHALLCSIDTKHVNLPDSLMYENTDSFSYAGYVTKKVGKTKNRHGATKMDGKSFLQNLTIWENDASILAENYVLMADVGFHNYVYDEEEKAMYILDPGRYQLKSMFTKNDCLRCNLRQIDELVKQIVFQDMIKCPEISKRKMDILMNMRKETGCSMHEFLEQSLDFEEYSTVSEYFIEKSRYIR